MTSFNFLFQFTQIGHMETTPVSSRRRGPRWLVPSKKLDIGASPVRGSSTASSSRDADSTCSPVTPSVELQRQMIEFEDDYDEVMPCTQNYQGGREVFWNYEASPKTRYKLQRTLTPFLKLGLMKICLPIYILANKPRFLEKYFNKSRGGPEIELY